jgi:voltage-gated potassium channel Kch
MFMAFLKSSGSLTHPIYSVRYSLRFHVFAVGLGTITREYGGTTIYISMVVVTSITWQNLVTYTRINLYATLSVSVNK